MRQSGEKQDVPYRERDKREGDHDARDASERLSSEQGSEEGEKDETNQHPADRRHVEQQFERQRQLPPDHGHARGQTDAVDRDAIVDR